VKRTPLRRRSAKAEARQVERAGNAHAAFGQHPDCAGLVAGVPACPRWVHGAHDAHEPRKRSQGADATDPAQMIPLCRLAHRWVHDHPALAARLRTSDGRALLLLSD